VFGKNTLLGGTADASDFFSVHFREIAHYLPG